MKEDKARNKECPQHLLMMVQMQIAGAKEGASERAINEMGKFGYYSASDCMMWAWDEAITKNAAGQQIDETNYNTEGHCGLITP